jgi:hypothetical protein
MQKQGSKPHRFILWIRYAVNIPLFMYEAGVEPSPLLLRPFIGLLFQPWMIHGDNCRAVTGMNEWQGKPKHSDKICPSTDVSTTDPTWLDAGSRPAHRFGNLASNRLKNATATLYQLIPAVVTCLVSEYNTRVRLELRHSSNSSP